MSDELENKESPVQEEAPKVELTLAEKFAALVAVLHKHGIHFND